MKRCIYCNKDKNESELSEEHVLPQAIGGNLSPTNPFKTPDVCKRCNNFCGLFVDTGFIKNWFTQAGRAEEALKHVKFDRDTIFPLRYMGPVPELDYDGKICETWIGPKGDSIYHFHYPYEEVRDMPVLVGPAPNIRSEIDKGFVFVFVVPSNPVWWQPILLSVAAQFPGSELYLANGKVVGGPYTEIPQRLVALHDKLLGMRGNKHCVRLQFSVDAGTRFLAKLALGLGHLLLSPVFSTSPDAQILRDMMWARNREERAMIPMRGTGFFGEDRTAGKQFLSWENGHVLTLLPTGGRLALTASFYGNQSATVQISETLEHWVGRGLENGVAYVISPGLRKFVGPISLPDMIAHRINEVKNVALTQLEQEVGAVPPLPPTHIDQVDQVDQVDSEMARQ